MPLRATVGIGYLRISRGAILWHMPGRSTDEVAPIEYNPTQDFSIASGNPNGIWSYGIMDVSFGAFTLLTLTYNISPFRGWMVLNSGAPWLIVFINTTASPVVGIPAGGLALHPMYTTGAPGVLRWTSPLAFRHVAIQGRFLPGDVSITTVSIRRGSKVLFLATNQGVFDLDTKDIAAGDALDFMAYGTTVNSSCPIEVLISGYE